jgi:hypothetical protein
MFNLTTQEIINGLDNGQTFPNQLLAEALQAAIDDTSKLDELQEETDDLYDIVKLCLNSQINAIIETSYLYNTGHTDAADGYSHCVGDDYMYNNRQTELVAFCEENNIDLTGIDIEKLENELLGDFQWLSSHIYSGAAYYDKFVLACFHVGEIETQIDFDSVTGLDKAILTKLKDNNDLDYHCGNIDNDSALFYQDTDTVWEAYVSIETIREYIAIQKD